ncbi:MAG: tRNA (adenosine(37)-N6)-threonylcarbamoyltransferase complex ATPase subunit type 1 TsaE [Cyclobacteriaceae bacterium]
MGEIIFDVMKRIFGLNELENVSKETVEAAQGLTVWLLEGEMGAGKTTLVKAIAKELGIKETVASPTFSIINEYKANNGQPVYHFDFYRMKNETEAYDIGANEYFESGNLCLVEWPEKIPSLIPYHYFKIKLEINDPQSRTIYYARH